jgi:hypothetical protein
MTNEILCPNCAKPMQPAVEGFVPPCFSIRISRSRLGGVCFFVEADSLVAMLFAVPRNERIRKLAAKWAVPHSKHRQVMCGARSSKTAAEKLSSSARPSSAPAT